MTDAPPQGTATAAPAPRRGLLLCLSHLRWDFVFQRPQHLLTRAARRGFDVVFLEEPIFGAETTRLETRTTPEGITIAVPHLPHGADAPAAQRAMLDALVASRRGGRLIAWFYTPMALSFAAHLRPDLTVYDCMDELSLFRGAPPELLENERALLARADLVFTGGRSLFEAKRGRHASVHCFPSSIDAPHFRAARDGGTEPADQAGIPRPRIGFFGVIDERMDIPLVGALAAARPDWSFAMLGPVVKIDQAELPRLPNLHWLGAKRYAGLPQYLAGWDAGFMPFARNESTRFISPTKTPEFLAAGLPLVSTPITDVVRDWGAEGAGLVAVEEDAAGFARAIGRMLAEDAGTRAAWRARVDRALATLSWDRTWSAMEALMEQALSGTATTTAAAPRPAAATTSPALVRSAP